jgi:hypothetical protein
MITSLAGMAGLLVQAAGHSLPARAARAPDPVRVWRTDSTVYVTLRDPGHLVLLNVDAIGRVGVLFPLNPGDSTSVSGDGPFDIPVPPEAQSNPSTLVAVRSRWAFDFAALRAGSTWNYQDAWLLQPTAGDPLAALLDIADRITDGRPYDYGVVTYTRSGTVATRRTPLQPTVCLSCVREGTSVAAAPAAIPTSAADCSNASLTNSFCGVANASVSITSMPQMAYQPPPPAAPAPVYVPYYLPIRVMHGEHERFERFERPFTPTPQRSTTAAFPIAPQLVVPSSSDLRTFTRRRP